MRIAIVTGASSGLGKEFVHQLDKKYHFDEIWVIARRKELLDELAAQVSTPVRSVPMDLTKQNDMDAFRALLKEEQPLVAMLINAAGMGKIGTYREISNESTLAMIDLNCKAAVDVTQSVLPYMKQKSRILEICSTSAFQPLPGLNVYAASKAFLLRYTRALRSELLEDGTGIRVTAVCPYWIKDTEFISVASQTESTAVKHFPFSSKCKNVVSHALYDNRMGFAVSTPGLFCTLHRIISKFIPHGIMMMFWEGIRRL